MTGASDSFRIHSSYALDAACFMSVLTGDEFYVSAHRAAYELWSHRLSAGARAAVARAVELRGSAMLGPSLCYVASAFPGFAGMDPAELLAAPDLIEPALRARPNHSESYWQTVRAVCQVLVPVLRELDELGFRTYWTNEHLPLIGWAANGIEQLMTVSPLDLGGAVAQMLGQDQRAGDGGIDLYLCTFAAPHGIRLFGNRYVADVRYKPEKTVRIAIHEMFHPPYRLADVEAEVAALMADPLFQQAFRSKDPKYGYETETGFLEENVVEAMELYVSTRAGLLADPIGYLLDHDGGSHKLSVVLLRYFNQVSKHAGEAFSSYLKRLTGLMPLGDLQREYDRAIGEWQANQHPSSAPTGRGNEP